MRIFSCYFIICTLFIGIAGTSLAAKVHDRDREVAQLITDLQSQDSKTRIDAAKIITRSGFSSRPLYTKLESLLKKGYPHASGRSKVDEMSWFCKALASSGNPDYAKLLDEIGELADSAKLRKYAKQSSSLIAEYASRRDIIENTAQWDNTLSAEENRFVNMLKSKNYTLKKDAAKLIYRGARVDDPVYKVVEEQILTMLPGATSSRDYDDTVAWLCKALASSGQEQYKSTLQKVVSSTKKGALHNHAQKALNRLQ